MDLVCEQKASLQSKNALECTPTGPIWTRGGVPPDLLIAIRIKTMRFEKMTTKLQEAIAEAQSMALGRDQQYIEPEHLLLALLNQDDGGIAGLISKAGGNPNLLKKSLAEAVAKLPVVEGTPGEV